MKAIVVSEWTKIRTLRSTFWTLLPTVVLSVGLGFLFALSFRNAMTSGSMGRRAQNFDPLFASFYSLTMGQLALVVFGVMFMTGEYSSGTIRASLTATPRRGMFYLGKLITGTVVIAGVSVVTVLITFVVAQATLGPYGTSLGADGVPTAFIGACLYLTFIGLFAAGVATMLRSSIAALAILLPVFFLGSQGLGNIPKVKTFTQYLPDQAGWVIMHLTGPDPQFSRDYGPWTGMGILALWTIAALVGGYLVLRRRDA